MKNKVKSILFVLVVLLLAPQFSNAAKEDTSKVKSIKEVVKSMKKIDGLFTLYQDTTTGSIQMLVEKDKLNQEFIYQSFSMGGPPDLFLNQNMIRSTLVFSIERSYNKIFFKQENTSFYYEPGKAISKSKNADVSKANFYTAKIKAISGDAYLIDVDDLFMGELMDPIKPNFGPVDPKARIFNLGKINKEKSSYLSIRSFPENTDVLVSLTYDNSQPKASSTAHVTDARFVDVKMQHSFIEMPKNNYKPRFDDPRVGYFVEQKDNVTTYDYPNYYDLIHRWNLEKKDPNAELSEPVKPIVWWLENTTPREYRQVIKEAGEKWNLAFEQAGFKNAVVMKQMPDDATWDPADIRYNVIRWVSSDLGFAIGPSFVNPRTGEILGADITIDYGMLLHTLTEQQLSEVGFKAHNYHFESEAGQNYQYCSMAQGKRQEQSLAKAMLMSMNASEEELKVLSDQFMTELIMHEMGHTMGLGHNMKASQMLSLEDAHNKEITRKQGVTASIMDYTIVNVHSDPSKQGDYYSTVPGPYDLWAIEYGYSQFSPDENEEGLKKILAKSSDPKLDYGNDSDILGNMSGVDPRVLTWDMGNDAIAYAKDRYNGINTRMGKLAGHFVSDDDSYHKFRYMYYNMQRGRASMSRAVSRYIGGVYVNRTFPGQQVESKPYEAVPYHYQKNAMAFLREFVFHPDVYSLDTELYQYLQPQRRGWNFGGKQEIPNIQSLVLGVQLNALGFLMHFNTMIRINNSSLYGNEYELTEMMNDLTNSCFEDDLKAEVNIFRQNLQSALVSQMIAAAKNSNAKYDYVSSSVCFSQLKNLDKMLKKNKGKDALTNAHRDKLRHDIAKVIDLD